MKAKELQELGQWKVGQKVVVHANPDALATVTRITDGRGGTIYLGHKTAFDIHGHQRSSDIWHSHCISPATDEDIRHIRGEIARAWLNVYHWSSLTGEQAIQIESFMNSIGINIRKK